MVFTIAEAASKAARSNLVGTQPVAANVQLGSEIAWDGNNLSVWAVTNGTRVLCTIPRATIHEVPPFGDAIAREIARDRAEIFDRLRSAPIAKMSRVQTGPLDLLPADLSA
jgi:hypothetical protein